MCGCGTWEYIGAHMTIPRLDAFNRYWERNPPVHMLVAAYMGIGAKAKPKKMADADIEALMKSFPQTSQPK